MAKGVSEEEKKLSREELKKLYVLLFDDWMSLPEEKILSLLKAKDQISDEITLISRGFPYVLKQILRYREKKQELNKLSTEELLSMYSRTNKERTAILAADVDDKLGDSFFEAPSIDSEEHIVYELLKERKAL